MDDGLPIALCASASTVAASFAPEQPAAHSTTLATTRRIFVMVEAPGCDDLYCDWDYRSSRCAHLRSELRATVILHVYGTTGSREPEAAVPSRTACYDARRARDHRQDVRRNAPD